MMVIEKYQKKIGSAAPLAVFRVFFGLMLLGGIIRFWSNGWIKSLYIDPKFYFTFYGFHWVAPLGQYTYLLFFICGLSALLVAIGLWYRWASTALFASFTYIELIDKSAYLNHYYFISLMCLLLIFLPANVYFSFDTILKPKIKAQNIPQWNMDALKLMMAILYFYAGLAKVNSDWLMEALPLKIWLPARNDMPIIGSLFNHTWIAYLFSWFGCIFDLAIPFLLWNKISRPYAYIAVIVFHVFTALLFPIGMFPYIMIVSALIFFPASFHQGIINWISQWFKPKSNNSISFTRSEPKLKIYFFLVFFAFQLVFPFRYLCYPGELFWTEEGYRFSWRVMLMEKAGYAQFIVKDATGKQQAVNNSDFLSPLQEKMMSTQADMLIQYAHILSKHYAQLGFINPEVYVDSYVALNGRLGKPLVGKQTNLAKETDSFKHKTWIQPLNDEIKGF